MESTTEIPKTELEAKSPEELIDLISELEPRPVRDFVPAGADSIKQSFLAGEITEPKFTYERLEAVDLLTNVSQLEEIRANLASREDVPQKYRNAYLEFADRYLSVYELMALSKSLNERPNTRDEEQYMKLSRELYGDVETDVFNGLINQLKVQVSGLETEDKAAQTIKDELLAMLPEVEAGASVGTKPSQETVDYWQEALEDFYGGMLAHVPEGQEEFNAEQIRDIFEQIIRTEFGEAAEDWQVVLEDATSITVKTAEKKIVIPNDRPPVTPEKLKELIVHEIGVHMLRSIMGEGTDMPLLKVGMSEYYDSEEGVGKVTEQIVSGEYQPAGEQYYIAAGLMLGAAGQPASFRQTYETIWRRQALEDFTASPEQQMTNELIAEAKDKAYTTVFRLQRGTNNPVVFLKDLAYFRGNHNAWKYLESAVGDEFAFSLIMLGKADPAISNHKRILLETKSV